MTAQDVGAEIDRDHNVGAHRARQRHGHGVDEPAVHQHHAVAQHRREQPGHGDRGAHRVERRAAAQPDFRPGVQRRRDRGERHGQLLDRAVREVAPEEIHQPLALEQAAAQAHIHEPDHVRDPNPSTHCSKRSSSPAA